MAQGIRGIQCIRSGSCRCGIWPVSSLLAVYADVEAYSTGHDGRRQTSGAEIRATEMRLGSGSEHAP